MNSKQNLLKDVISSKRLLRRELSFVKKNPELRKPYCCDSPKSSVVAFSADGDVLKVLGFKQN